MRIKVLLLGDDPVSLVADAQLMRERGILVLTAFNLANYKELIAEINPDVIFFDTQKSSQLVTDTYNALLNDHAYNRYPVIFNFIEDDLYLVTRRRTEPKNNRTIISDNIVDSIKMALEAHSAPAKAARETPAGNRRKTSGSGGVTNPGSQMNIPFYF